MGVVSYIRRNWKAGRTGGTPLSPDNLNVMDKGIADCAVAVNKNAEDITAVNATLAQLNSDLSAKLNYVEISKVMGMNAFTYNFDLSEYMLYPAKIGIITCTDDIGRADLQGICMFSISRSGITILNSTKTHLEFKASEGTLIISSKPGYPYGVRARIIIF